MRTRIRFTIILLIFSGSNIPALQAAEWKLDPQVNLKAGYNDNLRFATDNKLSSTELALDPSAAFSYQTPTSGITGTLGFLLRRYLEESDLDDNNATLDINSYLLRERSRAGFAINLIRDTTLDTELDETGLVFDRVNRFRGRFTPNWMYRFNERTSMDMSYTYSLVDYDEKDSGFFDFTSSGGQLTLSRILNEKSTASVTAGHTFTDSDNDVKSQYSFLQGGGSYRFSETFSLSLFGGVSRSKSEFTQQSLIPIFANDFFIGFTVLPRDAETTNDGLVFSGSLTKKYLRGEMSLTANRNISNSISGTLVEVTRVGLTSVYRFSATVSGELKLSASGSRTTNEIGSDLDRDYYQAVPRLTWQFKKFWSISGSYRYSKQTYGSSDDDAIQNAAYLTLNYNWPRIAVSR